MTSEGMMHKLTTIVTVLLLPGFAQSKPPAKPITATLKSGLTLTFPAAYEKQSLRKTADNVESLDFFQVKGLPATLLVMESKRTPGQTCVQQKKADDARGRKNRAKDKAELEKLMVMDVEKSCRLHEACAYVELRQRSAQEYRDRKPFRHGAAYSFCLRDHFLVVSAVMAKAGIPVSKTVKSVLTRLVKQLRYPRRK